jgi:hypothetical protein
MVPNAKCFVPLTSPEEEEIALLGNHFFLNGDDQKIRQYGLLTSTEGV